MNTIDNTLNANERDRMWAKRNEGWDKAEAWDASRYIEQLENQLTAAHVELERMQTRLTKAMYLILDKT